MPLVILFEIIYDRIYFSQCRSILNLRHQIIIAAISISAMLILFYYLAKIYPNNIQLLIALMSPIFIVIPLTYIAIQICWSYKKTYMMLKPEGKNSWSIHMGPVVSSIPCAYAKTPDNFIYNGIIAILKAAENNKLKGTVILESHLFGDNAKRQAFVLDLQNNIPNCNVSGSQTTEVLGRFNAYMLTMLRNKHQWFRWKSPPPAFLPNRPIGKIKINF